MVSAAARAVVNGHRSEARPGVPAAEKSTKKKSAKRGGVNGDGNVPEVGSDELIGQQYPGDAAHSD
jgi:arginine decarboxylase